MIVAGCRDCTWSDKCMAKTKVGFEILMAKVRQHVQTYHNELPKGQTVQVTVHFCDDLPPITEGNA